MTLTELLPCIFAITLIVAGEIGYIVWRIYQGKRLKEWLSQYTEEAPND